MTDLDDLATEDMQVHFPRIAAAEAKLAKAEAVVEAAERLVSPKPHTHEGMPPGTSCTATHFPTTRRDELRRALATYRQSQVDDG